MPIQFTRKGRYEVWRDGQKISEHNQEREATEQIINHSSVYGDGDYEIKGYLVVARVVGSVNPQTGDTTPPTTPGSVSASATSATTGTVTWTASTDSSGVAGYQIFLDGAPLSPTTTNLFYSLTGLSPSTQYAVTVVAFDAAGNNSVAGGPALFTTDANSAPVWSLGNQAYETGASVSISLDTVCTDADGDTITYSLVSGSLPSGLALSGARNETLSGTVDTVETAVFTLGASDGIASVQNVALTFTITAPDTVAPAAPTGLSVISTTSSSINLDWADNAESDLASYDVYRSTVGASGPWGKRNPSPLTASNYADTGLNEQTQYWYYVTATDDSGNESVASSVVSSTTNAIVTGSNTTRINSLLTAIGATVPFTQAYPADPVTTSGPTEVTPATLSANLVSGRQLILQEGDYGNLTMPSVQDVDMIIEGAGTFETLNLGNSGIQRLRITWQTPRAGYVRQFVTTEAGNGPTDVLIDGMNMEGGSARAYVNSTRMAIINSRMDAGTGSQAMSSFNQNTENLTVINCEIIAPGTGDSVIRLQHVDNLVFVGNRAAATSGSFFPFRLHSVGASLVTTIENAYVAFNQFEGSRVSVRDRCCGSSPFPVDTQVNLYWEDNNSYEVVNSAAVASFFDPGANGGDAWTYIRMRRNNAYGSVGVYFDGSPWTGRGYEISGNTVSGSVTTPTWSFL